MSIGRDISKFKKQHDYSVRPVCFRSSWSKMMTSMFRLRSNANILVIKWLLTACNVWHIWPFLADVSFLGPKIAEAIWEQTDAPNDEENWLLQGNNEGVQDHQMVDLQPGEADPSTKTYSRVLQSRMTRLQSFSEPSSFSASQEQTGWWPSRTSLNRAADTMHHHCGASHMTSPLVGERVSEPEEHLILYETLGSFTSLILKQWLKSHNLRVPETSAACRQGVRGQKFWNSSMQTTRRVCIVSSGYSDYWEKRIKERNGSLLPVPVAFERPWQTEWER